MSDTTTLVWFREDLRIHDNRALLDALETGEDVLPVYSFDPREFDTGMFDLPKIGPYRARFLTAGATSRPSSMG